MSEGRAVPGGEFIFGEDDRGDLRLRLYEAERKIGSLMQAIDNAASAMRMVALDMSPRTSQFAGPGEAMRFAALVLNEEADRVLIDAGLDPEEGASLERRAQHLAELEERYTWKDGR